MNGVTFAQVMVVSDQRCAALPAELAGCMVLAVADALSSLPLNVSPQELILLEDGTIRLCGGAPTDDRIAEATLRELLGRILLSACSVTPALLRAARRPPQGRMLELVRELEVALIPTNRGAARRALARLYREVAQSLKQDPSLQDAVDALQSCDSARVEVQPELPTKCAPIVVKEPEILEEWIDVSPGFPDIVANLATPCQDCHTTAAASSIDIPDLEIPNYATPALLPEASSWQPIEHTQRLCTQQGFVAEVPICVIDNHAQLSVAPSEPDELSEIDLEYVEVSEGDFRELTVELPTAAVAEKTAQLQKQPEQALVSDVTLEHQTAEPFLLVLPSQGQDMPLGITLPQCKRLDQASPVDATQVEPCAGEAEATVLDVVTAIDEEELEYLADQLEPVSSEIDDEIESELPSDLTYLHEESVAAAAVKSPEETEDQSFGPHHYVAPARFSRKASDVTSRVDQFSVAKTNSVDELTRGLRNLAGIENEVNFEPTATPPPTVYAAEQGAPESIPSGTFVKTLIGIGATGLAIALAQMSSGKVASVSGAAHVVPNVAVNKPCKAILKIAEVPAGTLIRVTQSGSNAKIETAQSGQVPVRIGELTCGVPAELLVKLSDRGWYRIPIDGNRLSAGENPEPVRILPDIKP